MSEVKRQRVADRDPAGFLALMLIVGGLLIGPVDSGTSEVVVPSLHPLSTVANVNTTVAMPNLHLILYS